MNLRHTAALALMGWYLMVPDQLHFFHPGSDREPPLFQWRLLGGFDSAAKCQAQIKKMLDVFNDPHHGGYGEPWTRWDHAQCVASDDPRLRGWNLIVPLIQKKEFDAEWKASPIERYTNGDGRIDVNAPLSEWLTMDAAESERECYASIAGLKKTADSGRQKADELEREYGAVIKKLADQAKCVATDDPRLKEK
jgi:hypothetical protein